MKYVLFSIFVLVFIVSGCLAVSGRLDSGGIEGGDVLEGTGMGFRGPIIVRLLVKDGNITDIEVDSIEDRFVGGVAIEQLVDLIIGYNSTDVDAVTGATETSRGFLSAVESAIISGRK